jgi:hypothetical protein
MEEAIGKFVDGLETQESSGFDSIHRLIQRMPVPVLMENRTMTRADALGSNVYEINLWPWSFARSNPRMGGLTVDQTFERQVAAGEASKERVAENRQRRKAGNA